MDVPLDKDTVDCRRKYKFPSALWSDLALKTGSTWHCSGFLPCCNSIVGNQGSLRIRLNLFQGNCGKQKSAGGSVPLQLFLRTKLVKHWGHVSQRNDWDLQIHWISRFSLNILTEIFEIFSKCRKQSKGTRMTTFCLT